MSQKDLLTTPQTFPEANQKHFSRSASVLILKRLKNFVDPGMSTSSEYDTFRKEFAEFLRPGTVLMPLEDMNKAWPNPDDSSKALYKHFAIVTSAEPTIAQSLGLDSSAPSQYNMDVMQITATESTEGRGTCTIVLNSREDKYLFQKNPLRLGQSIFESNDEVYVDMSDATEQGNLSRVFTGLITTITIDTILGDTLQTQITIQCEDRLKLLAQSRTCLKPSGNAKEARGAQISWVNPGFAAESTHRILSDILSRAYCDVFTAPGFRSDLIRARANQPASFEPSLFDINAPAINDPQSLSTAAQREEDLIQHTLPFPSSTGPTIANQNVIADPDYPFLVVVNDTKNRVTASGDGLAPNAFENRSTSIPTKIYGLRRIIPTNNGRLVAQSEALGDLLKLTPNTNIDDIAFVIDGTKQPAYALTEAGSLSVYFSDWKSGLAVCNEIAQNLNYEFYADFRGIVRFRPLNVSLPIDFKTGGLRATNQVAGAGGRVGSEYWLDPQFISAQSYTDTDNGIFTIARVLGDLPIGDAGKAQQWHGTAVDLMRYNKLGPRMAPIITKFNLITEQACQAYAWGYLSRLNGNAIMAQITYTGDSRLHAGNPCYVKHKNTIYYITSITHNFTAGQSYTTTLTLKYGRHPVAIVDTPPNITDPVLSAFISNKTVDNYLTDLREQDGPLDLIVGESLSTTFSPTAPLTKSTMGSIVDFIDNNREHLTFQGYLWEMLSPLSYEELYKILGDQQYVGANAEASQHTQFKDASYRQKVSVGKLSAIEKAVNAQVTPISTSEQIKNAFNSYLKQFGGAVKFWNR